MGNEHLVKAFGGGWSGIRLELPEGMVATVDHGQLSLAL